MDNCPRCNAPGDEAPKREDTGWEGYSCRACGLTWSLFKFPLKPGAHSREPQEADPGTKPSPDHRPL